LAELEAALEGSQPHLVVCGWRLGNLAGAELVERVRAHHGRYRLIILTEPGQRLDITEATRNRIVAFLPHPWDARDLVRFAKAALELGEAHRNRREHNRYIYAMETHCDLINPFGDSEGRPIAAMTRDVSRSGMAMLVFQLIPVPAMLKITITLSDHTHPISKLAKSISCTLTPVPGVYRLGAKFIGLLPKGMEQSIAELSRPSAGGADSNIGRTLKGAVHLWLDRNRDAVAGQIEGSLPTVDAIATELLRNVDEDQADNGRSASVPRIHTI
jgi:CheY-like chemotaxis protein